MNVRLKPEEVHGTVSSPPSKSMTHRAYICSSLATGMSTVLKPLISDDTDATRNLLEALGINFTGLPKGVEIHGGTLRKPQGDLYCRDSGTTLRLMTPICSLIEGAVRLTGGESLSKRPIGPLLDGLTQLNVKCESNDGYPPVTIHGTGVINGGTVYIPGDISSQFISALLLVAPLAEEPVNIELTTPLESKPYVQMTLDFQRKYGVNVNAAEDYSRFTIPQGQYSPAVFHVEGDWSSASFLLVSGSLAGEVTVQNLDLNSSQADAEIVQILESMGAILSFGENQITVVKSPLEALSYDISDSPDLFPIVAALCSKADGESIISGTRRLKFKESDRAAAMKEGLTRMGIQVVQSDDEFRVQGGDPAGATIDPRNDHRIAMAFAVLGLSARGETIIEDAECVSKSYPGFWKDLESLDVKYVEEDK